MKIKDQPALTTKPKPFTFAPEDTVQQALDVMCEHNIGSVVVIHPDETVAGMVTERDMMKRILHAQRDPKTTQLSEIMTTDVHLARESDSLVNWMQTMSNKRFRHLPVVDEHDKLINVMSQGDFLVYTWPDLYEKVRHDLRGRLSRWFQGALVVFALLTLGLIALEL